MSVFNTGNCVESGGRGFVRKASSSSSPHSSSRAGIYKFYVCSPQERRGKSFCSQFEASEPVSSVRALQNGGYPHVEGFTKKGGFSGKNRPQRSLSDGANLERPPKISTFCLEELPFGVLLSPFRLSNGTKGVYKTYETSRRGPKTKRDSVNYIFRRHFNNGRILQSSTAACSLNLEPPRRSRLHSKLSEVPAQALSGTRISWVFDKFQHPITSASRGKVAKDPQKMSAATRPNNNLSSRIVQIPGPPNLLNSGDIFGSPPLQASAKPKNCYLGQSKNLRSSIVSKPSSQSGNSLVKRSSPCMEWQGPVSGPGRSFNRERCFSKGLGSLLPRSEYRWPLVFGRKEITHQLPRASSGFLCYQNIHQNQSLSSLRFQRLETQSDSVSGTFQNLGPFRGRSICIPADTSTTHIRQLETRSTGGLHRCIFGGLGENSGLCLSTLCPNRSLSTTASGTGDGPPSAGAPVWPTQSWYPLLLQMSIDLPVLIPPSPQLLSKGELLHPLTNLQLGGWRLSAKTVKHQNFQKKLERFCWQPGDKVLAQPIPLPGVSGLAGVLNEKLFHFQLL